MSDLVKRYRDLQISIGGCHDGYCVIKKPQGMHTNGGCNCLEDMKLHERSRVGGLLKYGQEMADRIEELEANLKKAAEALEQIASHRKKCHEYDDDVGHERREFDVEDMIIMEYAARTTLAELKGQDDE